MPRPDSKGKLVKPSFAARLGKITRQVERAARSDGIGPRQASPRPPILTPMLGKSPGTTIAAGGWGTVTLYVDGRGATLGTRTITAYNPHPSTAVPANSKVWVVWDRGYWSIMGWYC